MKPLTIIIPCYNMEKYILIALTSILKQKNQEEFCDVFIIDDGSQDESKKIVKEFIDNNNLNNFYYYKKDNGNWGSVINFAKNNLNLNSKYVTILDADDYYKENLFIELKKHINYNYDLIFTGFYEIKKEFKIHKGYLIPGKGNEKIKKKYMRFPSLIPLCKFFKTDIFVQLDDLEEKVSYQDIILWNKFIDISNSFYYIKKEYGYYLNHREGASSTQPFNEQRIKIMMKIINKLLINKDIYLNGYLMALLMHLKKNTSKEKRKFIILEGQFQTIRKFKLLWCPFGTRTIVKIGMFLYLNKLLINGSF